MHFTEEYSFGIFPNPATDIITIKNAETGKFLILNMSGQTVMKLNLSSDENRIDITDLLPGLYYISNTGRTQSHRFIKQ